MKIKKIQSLFANNNETVQRSWILFLFSLSKQTKKSAHPSWSVKQVPRKHGWFSDLTTIVQTQKPMWIERKLMWSSMKASAPLRIVEHLSGTKPSCWYSNLWFSLKKNPSNDFTQMQILLIRSGVLNRARGFRILRQLFKHSNHSDVPFKHLNENKGRMKLQKHKQRKSSMLDQVRLNGHTTWFSD